MKRWLKVLVPALMVLALLMSLALADEGYMYEYEEDGWTYTEYYDDDDELIEYSRYKADDDLWTQEWYTPDGEMYEYFTGGYDDEGNEFFRVYDLIADEMLLTSEEIRDDEGSIISGISYEYDEESGDILTYREYQGENEDDYEIWETYEVAEDEEEDILLKQELVLYEDDGSYCVKTYDPNLVEDEMTLTSSYFYDEYDEELPGSTDYFYDDNGDDIGCQIYQGIARNGHYMFDQYDADGKLTCKTQQWYDYDDEKAYIDYYTAKNKFDYRLVMWEDEEGASWIATCNSRNKVQSSTMTWTDDETGYTYYSEYNAAGYTVKDYVYDDEDTLLEDSMEYTYDSKGKKLLSYSVYTGYDDDEEKDVWEIYGKDDVQTATKYEWYEDESLVAEVYSSSGRLIETYLDGEKTSTTPKRITLTPSGSTSLSLEGELEIKVSFDLPTDCSDITWTSSNKSIAEVYDGVVKPLKPGKVTITAKAVNGGKSAKLTVNVFDPTMPTSIVFDDGKSIEVDLNDEYVVLGTTMTPERAESGLKFTSSNKKVATVDEENGEVTLLAEGRTKITVVTNRNTRVKATITVTVKDYKKPTSIAFDSGKSTEADLSGEALTLGTTMYPSEAESGLKFTSSNKKVADVTQDGTIIPKAKGTVKITVVTTKNSKAKATITVTIKDSKEPTGIVISGESKLTMNMDEKLTLEHSFVPEKAESAVTYVSSNKRVATVSTTGEVVAIKEGTAKITVTTTKNKKVKAVVTITVVDPTKATAVAFVDSAYEAETGEEFTLATQLTPSTATSKVTFTSSNRKVVQVNKDGTLTALKEGTATITAKTSTGKTAKIVVTVVAPKAQPIVDELLPETEIVTEPTEEVKTEETTAPTEETEIPAEEITEEVEIDASTEEVTTEETASETIEETEAPAEEIPVSVEEPAEKVITEE